MFQDLCDREKAPVAFVGEVTGDGRIVLHDERDGSTPVNMELEHVLGSMPQKTFDLQRIPPRLEPLELPEGVIVEGALERVLRLLSVGSKRFLTNKVDRCVTGLVARQQCAGPLQLTVADVAVMAQSHFGVTGAATAIGEQPIKGLLDPVSMARMTVGEALTNLVWARVSALEDVKCSANWMWAAKLPGEGAALHDAALAMAEMMEELGIAVDGGKDSLSMAALAPGPGGEEETVKAPGSLVVSAYVTCPDITATVTPDLKLPERGRIFFVDLGGGRNRLGGSALAQVYGQVGDLSPDVEDSTSLVGAFRTVQGLLEEGLLTAGHDRSDGGLVTALLEMAFAGNCGVEVELRGMADGTTPFIPRRPSPSSSRRSWGSSSRRRRRTRTGSWSPSGPWGSLRANRLHQEGAPRHHPGGGSHRPGPGHAGAEGRLGGDQLPPGAAPGPPRPGGGGAGWAAHPHRAHLPRPLPRGPHRPGDPPSAGQATGGGGAGGGEQLRPGDGLGLPPGGIRGVGRHHVGPAWRAAPASTSSRVSGFQEDSPTPTSWIRPRGGRGPSASTRTSWSNSGSSGTVPTPSASASATAASSWPFWDGCPGPASRPGPSPASSTTPRGASSPVSPR
jgi:hypothetical protein